MIQDPISDVYSDRRIEKLTMDIAVFNCSNDSVFRPPAFVVLFVAALAMPLIKGPIRLRGLIHSRDGNEWIVLSCHCRYIRHVKSIPDMYTGCSVCLDRLNPFSVTSKNTRSTLGIPRSDDECSFLKLTLLMVLLMAFLEPC